MTVAELIEALRQLPPDTAVRVRGEEYDWTEHICVWWKADTVSIEAES